MPTPTDPLANVPLPDAAVKQAVEFLTRFIGRNQLQVIKGYCRGEEGEWFKEKLVALWGLIERMPKTYQTDGKGDAAIVWLHYFSSSYDWWIIERDSQVDQHQAFGLVRMHEVELGYIGLPEILGSNAVEIDLHWTPVTLAAVRAKLLNV